MALTCKKCGEAGTICVCNDTCTKEATCTCQTCQEQWRCQCVECEEDFHPSALNAMGLCQDCAQERIDFHPHIHPYMQPVEIQGAVDKSWRQFRDKANQNGYLRRAVKELFDQLEERAEELSTAALDIKEEMSQGGIHPNTRRFMD